MTLELTPLRGPKIAPILRVDVGSTASPICRCGAAQRQAVELDSTPDVLGGEARIVRTRIPVWMLVQARRLGATEAELLRSYPTLRAEDLTNAWAYAGAHSDEIEQQILENETA